MKRDITDNEMIASVMHRTAGVMPTEEHMDVIHKLALEVEKAKDEKSITDYMFKIADESNDKYKYQWLLRVYRKVKREFECLSNESIEIIKENIRFNG